MHNTSPSASWCQTWTGLASWWVSSLPGLSWSPCTLFVLRKQKGNSKNTMHGVGQAVWSSRGKKHIKKLPWSRRMLGTTNCTLTLGSSRRRLKGPTGKWGHKPKGKAWRLMALRCPIRLFPQTPASESHPLEKSTAHLQDNERLVHVPGFQPQLSHLRSIGT